MQLWTTFGFFNFLSYIPSMEAVFHKGGCSEKSFLTHHEVPQERPKFGRKCTRPTGTVRRLCYVSLDSQLVAAFLVERSSTVPYCTVLYCTVQRQVSPAYCMMYVPLRTVCTRSLRRKSCNARAPPTTQQKMTYGVPYHGSYR